MKRKTLAVGIVLLFIITSVTPMVIGYNADVSEDDEYSENISYANYVEYENIEFENYREISKGELIENRKSYEIPNSKKTTQVLPLDGPMDSPWPMKCHDTHHTGLSPYSTADNPLEEMWKFRTTNWMNSGIIIGDDDTIYFGCFDGYLHALNQYGTEKWRYKTGMWIWSAPAIDEDGTIYVTSYDDYLHAVNPDGTEKWKFDAGDSISSSPVIGDGGIIYFGTMGDECNIFAVNPNGTEKWRYGTGELAQYRVVIRSSFFKKYRKIPVYDIH